MTGAEPIALQLQQTAEEVFSFLRPAERLDSVSQSAGGVNEAGEAGIGRSSEDPYCFPIEALSTGVVFASAVE